MATIRLILPVILCLVIPFCFGNKGGNYCDERAPTSARVQFMNCLISKAPPSFELAVNRVVLCTGQGSLWNLLEDLCSRYNRQEEQSDVLRVCLYESSRDLSYNFNYNDYMECGEFVRRYLDK